MKPDPQRVRALSGHLSAAESMWKGLPCQDAMRAHLGALQTALSNMLDALPVEQIGDEISEQLADALLTLGRPDAVMLRQIHEVSDHAFSKWIRANPIMVRRRMAQAGYGKIANPTDCKGSWSLPAGNATIYARCDLPIEDRLAAARALVAAERVRGAGPKNSAAQPRKPPRASKSTQRPLSATDEGQGQ